MSHFSRLRVLAVICVATISALNGRARAEAAKSKARRAWCIYRI